MSTTTSQIPTIPTRVSELSEKGQEAYKEDRDDYKLRLESYKIRERDYQEESNKISKMVEHILTTVTPHLQLSCCTENGTPRDWITALQDTVGVDEDEERARARERYQAALKPMRSTTNWETWLNEYDQAATRAETLEVAEVMQTQAVIDDFLGSKASIHLQWAPGHNDVKGNEKADTLAKEAAKERPTTSTIASLAYLGTEINKIQKTEQLMEYKRYTDRPTKNRSSYSRIFKLNTHTTIKVPKGTPREISSAFYSLKLGHGYFNSYLKRFNKRDCNLCICYKPQTPQHLLLECKQYKTHRNTLKEAIPHRPITLPLLLQTKTGIKATLAFIASTRIGTRKWHLGQTTEQTDTV
ncbi:hypothetical protein PtrM4_057140 [Pyrenophora tritici-repentis]|uniref:RNase H type-1 domain-containing protein n=1 Tax=Pyrenophora tritici-repentis TaxID=45151 RepID=A0A834S183_9PLEO|nr:hypothetical protein PtrM4_057140 [Pyrenophora tritici-repentis]